MPRKYQKCIYLHLIPKKFNLFTFITLSIYLHLIPRKYQKKVVFTRHIAKTVTITMLVKQ